MTRKTKGETNMAPATKSYTIFDLDNMESKKVEVSYEFNPAENYADAVTRAGSDETKLLKFVNAGLKREVLAVAKKTAMASGASKAIVFKFVAPFRMSPQFSSLITAADGTPEAREQRKKQTKAILDYFKSNAGFVQMIRDASEAAEDSDDETEGETDAE